MRKFAFLLIGLAAFASGLFQPQDRSPQAQHANIRATMESHGYTASGGIAMGRALTVTQFSSADCGNIRVLPVSIQFQEGVLLNDAGHPGDQHLFVYRNQVWAQAPRTQAVFSHWSEKFRQMARLKPDPATDTMLYIVTPKTCHAPQIDWSRFWVA
jgi:hypothetical protein